MARSHMAVSRSVLIFFKLAGNQVFQRVQRFLFVLPFRHDGDLGAVAYRQHHQTQNTLAVNFLAILLLDNVCIKFAGQFDELSSRTRVNAEFVDDGELLGDHGI